MALHLPRSGSLSSLSQRGDLNPFLPWCCMSLGWWGKALALSLSSKVCSLAEDRARSTSGEMQRHVQEAVELRASFPCVDGAFSRFSRTSNSRFLSVSL
jgi:hypothetical protein